MKLLKAMYIVGLGMLLNSSIAYSQKDKDVPVITSVASSSQFAQIIREIALSKNALFVFDVDNTLLITNENKFGSDWWFSQAKSDPNLKLNVSNSCLYDVLIPLFYSVFGSVPVFDGQAQIINSLDIGKDSRTIALTSRGYSSSVAYSTELELTGNLFEFLQKDSVTLGEDVIMLNGVIYTKGQNKGSILLSYARKYGYNKIFYFDDSKSKVDAVQKAFIGESIDISIYHMLIAPKIPYTEEEKAYMEEKLCNLIETLNASEITTCACDS